jgi:hypothetical protein
MYELQMGLQWWRLYLIIAIAMWTWGIEKSIAQEATPAGVVRPADIGIGAVQERVNVNGFNDKFSVRGEFQAVGSVAGASWYLKLDKPNLFDAKTWNISDLNVIDLNPDRDWVFGTQPAFWRRQGSSNSYVGVTTIQRSGFTPPQNISSGNFQPSERLQSNSVGRSIAGVAAPGTLVRLVKGTFNQPLGEVLVDSSGLYRFSNVEVSGNNSFGNEYRLLLYRQGQLTSDPESRNVTFTTTPGQLPAGASATIVSAGAARTAGGGILGNVERAEGGVAYRRGIDESLTIGIGGIFDREPRGLAEIFWQPNGIPIQATASALSGTGGEIVGNISYRPSPKFNANVNIDSFSSRVNANWQLTPGLSIDGNYGSREGVGIGSSLFLSSGGASTSIRASIDDRSRFRWSLGQSIGDWQGNIQGNEIGTSSELSYRLPIFAVNNNSEVTANYQFSYQPTLSELKTILWRYRSTQKNSGGQSLWQGELGYGWSSLGDGGLGALELYPLSGIQLRTRYQGVSSAGKQNNFSAEILVSLETQGGVVSAKDSAVDLLRRQGKVRFKPFLDANRNGKQDTGEKDYWHPQLIQLDGKSPVAQAEMLLNPGNYRLIFTTAGYPANHLPQVNSLQIESIAGGNTIVPIPLIPSQKTATAKVSISQSIDF